MSKRPESQGQPSSLIKMLESTGGTRGGSATPVASGPSLISPQPQRNLQGKVDHINHQLRHTTVPQGITNQNKKNSSRRNSVVHSQGGHQRNQSMSSRSVASPDDQGVKISHHSRGTSAYQTVQNQDMMYSDRNSAASSNISFAARDAANQVSSTRVSSTQNSSHRMSPTELSVKLQERLAEVEDMIEEWKDIPRDLQEKLSEDLRQISYQYDDTHRAIMKDFDRYKNDRDELRRQLRFATEQNTKLVMENNDLVLQHKKSAEKFAEIDSRWKRIQEDLMDEIARQKEQIDGRRALWLEANPGSSARRDAMKSLKDPFQSPSASKTPHAGGGAMSAMTSPSDMTPYAPVFVPASMGPPQMQLGSGGHAKVPPSPYVTADVFGSSSNVVPPGRRETRPRQNTGPPPALERRRGKLPTGAAVPNAYKGFPYAPTHNVGSYQPFLTEPGTPPPPKSKALVLHKTDEELAAEYKAAITKLYQAVEEWVRSYSCVPNQANDRAIASGNSVLWDYMMNCTYPGHRQDSHTHVVALLSNPGTRFWFVMRMATQYCVKDMMTISAFKPHSKGVEKVIDTVLLKLEERGLNNEARQQCIDRASEAVRAVIESKTYRVFRSQQLGIHTKALRDMLGPLLDDGVTRASAGVDLGAIAVLAWDLSCKMHTARLTFQIYFPETNGKFSAATMKAKDLVTIDPMQLQIEQVRLKLVITPVITMRDDRGTTIRAKAIHSAYVLLMK